MTLSQGNASKLSGDAVGTEPVISFEVQCVVCLDELDLASNFERDRQRTAKRKKREQQGVVRKVVTSPKILLVGFVAENTEYVVRVKCQNRNGWSGWSECRFELRLCFF